MIYLFFLIALCSGALPAPLYANHELIKLSPSEVATLGRKIWHNECGASVEKLTWWKKGEEFASLGIGHFIWFPAHYHGPFKQQFPTLLNFLKKHGIKLPAWLRGNHVHCPWKTHEEFYRDINSPRMQELRTLLSKTIKLQAQFIVQQFQHSLQATLKKLPAKTYNRTHIQQQLHRILTCYQGVYALIDYANFKGMSAMHEQYNGHGWGLMDVLNHMQGTSLGCGCLHDFTKAAKEVLLQRVVNSPPARNEAQWLPGWFNRVDTYVKF